MSFERRFRVFWGQFHRRAAPSQKPKEKGAQISAPFLYRVSVQTMTAIRAKVVTLMCNSIDNLRVMSFDLRASADFSPVERGKVGIAIPLYLPAWSTLASDFARWATIESLCAVVAAASLGRATAAARDDSGTLCGRGEPRSVTDRHSCRRPSDGSGGEPNERLGPARARALSTSPRMRFFQAATRRPSAG
jgi:hypothetical protein